MTTITACTCRVQKIRVSENCILATDIYYMLNNVMS